MDDKMGRSWRPQPILVLQSGATAIFGSGADSIYEQNPKHDSEQKPIGQRTMKTKNMMGQAVRATRLETSATLATSKTARSQTWGKQP
jgi:hypothetical protein